MSGDGQALAEDGQESDLGPHRPGRLGKARWPKGDGPTVIDIFSGGGGMSLGFRSAGYRIVAAVDKDPVASTVYRKNAPEVPFIGPTEEKPDQGDISKVTGAMLLKQTKLRKGSLGLLVGGPPCQGYSEIGRRRPDDERNTLYLHFVRLLKELRPTAYVFENVRGLMSMLDADGNRVLESLLAAFRDAGYTATPYLIEAASYGIPQFRKRLFIVGTRIGKEIILEPGPYSQTGYVTVGDALCDLPNSLDNATAVLHALPYSGAATSDYAKLLRGSVQLARNSAPTHHAEDLLQRLISVPVGGADKETRHRRLEPAKPAWTIRAGTRYRTACRPIHPVEHRVITVREAARLSSFPDEFWLPDGKAPGHMIVGNSVPPLLAHHLACSIAAQIFATWRSKK